MDGGVSFGSLAKATALAALISITARVASDEKHKVPKLDFRPPAIPRMVSPVAAGTDRFLAPSTLKPDCVSAGCPHGVWVADMGRVEKSVEKWNRRQE